jgi:signal transduction histidine kinase/ligand-binding sensor domain-containing protein
MVRPPLSRARYALLCLLFWVTRVAYGQLPAITFETISSKDGLPGNTVLSAVRDKAGFMWFGTRQHVVRYDGASFKSFMDPETNFVTGLAADANNDVWLSSDRNGLCVIRHDSQALECFAQTPEPTDLETTGYFFLDRHRQGWYSDRDGVNRIDLATGKRKHYALRKSTYVWMKAVFTEDTDGNLWVVGRDNGLFRFDRGRDTLVCVLGQDCSPAVAGEPMLFAAACAGDDGSLWLGSYNYGLIRYDIRRNTWRQFLTGRRSNQVNSVVPGHDENGRAILWVGDNQGLGVFRPDRGQFYFFADVLPKPYEVNYIYRDPENGIVWTCTSEGIIKYNPESNLIRTLLLPPGLVSSPVTVNAVVCDPQDSSLVYLGLSHTGMVRWNRHTNEFTLVRYPNESAETRWLVAGDGGTLWIGTNRWDYERPGIFVYDTRREKFITTPLSQQANRYFSVPFFMYGQFDAKHRLWIGNSDEGVHGFDGRSAREITPWDTAAQRVLLHDNNLINALRLGADGRLWLGTMRGIYVGDTTTRSFVPADPAGSAARLHDLSVNSLLHDRAGNLWAARWGSLTCMNATGDLVTVLTTRDGFVDRQVQGLAEDHAGNIWAGNYEGLYCYHAASGKLKRFTTNDGLMHNNTMGRIFTNPEGTALYVGQQNGINIIDVGRLFQPTAHAALGITSFNVHERERTVGPEKVVQLAPADNAFSIGFIALNYRKQHDNVYAYYLEGFEKDWNHSGSHHRAYYTNLSPGRYTLHVKAGDVLGHWSTEAAIIQLEVLPAYYETAWFRALIFLAVCGLLYGLYRYRINQLLRLQHVRNRISADLHDELGSSLSGISIMGTLAKKDLPVSHPSASFVERMVEEVQQMSSSLDDIVWNISPRNDALSSLVARMTRYASELFEARQIHYTISVPDHFDLVRLSMEQRRNFYLIFKESVNNLIKYAQCQQASVVITVEKKKLCMTITDDGVGFDPAVPHGRNGLLNLRQRANSLRGTLQIFSARGKGTSLVLEFPI